MLFTFLNGLFFGSLFFAALLTGRQYVLQYTGSVDRSLTEANGLLTVFVSIFLFNFVVSCFLVLTATGLLFFALPIGLLIVRAALWGLMLNRLSTPAFLVTFLTLLFEGEGYVVAGVAGVDLGLAWLKPTWIGEGMVSRREVLKQALKECVYLYVLVVPLLLAAAVIEAFTLHLV